MTKPLIVILCLEDISRVFETTYCDLLSQLRSRAKLLTARSSSEALRYLTSTVRPRAIVVPEPAITHAKYRNILLHLVEYVKSGGTVVYAGFFAAVVNWIELDLMFKGAWDLPWHMCAYTSDEFRLNPHLKGLNEKALTRDYHMKAVHLNHVALNAAVYLSPVERKKLRKGKGRETSGETYVTPAAFTSIGRGRLGYVGDVNPGVPTTQLVIAMCFAPGSHAPVVPGSGIRPPMVSEEASTPVVTTVPKRKVVILSLEKEPWIDELYTPLYHSLNTNAEMSEVLTVRAANVELSATPPPHAILVSDVAITRPKYGAILNRLIEYARAGCIVVLGMQFSNHLRLDLARSFFARWDVPWDVGSYHRTTFALNPTGVPAPLLKDALQPSYSMKAVHLKNVPRASAVYLPTSTSRVESHVFAPTPIIGERAEESPAVFGSVGRGYLGYVGDVNGEQGSLRLMIEMCGVRIQPGDIGARTFSSSVTMRPDGTWKAIKETEEEIPLPAAAVPPAATHEPREREAEVVSRAERRVKTRQEKMKIADALKNEGNDLFVEEEWAKAAAKYREAALIAGPQPVYMSNLAAALLKMKKWELVDSAASRALLHDPKHVKALFRRAQARRRLRRYAAAGADIELLLSIDKTNRSAREEREAILDSGSGIYWSGDKEYAKKSSFDAPFDIEDESDSEDFTHEGNGKPCKFYNREGCRDGQNCRFKHSPDSRSVRDELGRNVCVYWLVGECRFDSRCAYAHDKMYLPRSGWWTDEARLSSMRKEFDDAVGANPLPLLPPQTPAGAAPRESMLPEALKPFSWRKDLWAVASYEKVPGEDEDSDEDEEWEEAEDEWEERAENFGYRRAEVEEMLMYGIKPYDLDAYEELVRIRTALNDA